MVKNLTEGIHKNESFDVVSQHDSGCAKRTVADWLWPAGIALIAAIWGLFGLGLTLGLGRMGRASPRPVGSALTSG